MALPQITLVDSAVKLNQIIYEADESLQNDRVLAYLNQVGLINYNDEKECVNGHLMELKKVKRADGWWWRCGQKGCQKSESIRKGTFFYDGKIKIWVVLLMIFNFAFESLNTTTRQLDDQPKRVLLKLIFPYFNLTLSMLVCLTQTRRALFQDSHMLAEYKYFHIVSAKATQ